MQEENISFTVALKILNEHKPKKEKWLRVIQRKYLTFGASQVVHTVKNSPAMQETWVRYLCWEDSLEEGMQPTPVFLTGESPWTEDPGELQFVGSQTVRHNWVTKHSTGGSLGKNLPGNAGDVGDSGSIPGSGTSSQEGNGNPLQYSSLENQGPELASYTPWSHKKSDTTEHTHTHLTLGEDIRVLTKWEVWAIRWFTMILFTLVYKCNFNQNLCMVFYTTLSI